MKNVDIKVKKISLQSSWVKKLFDGNRRDWKIIPLFLINKYFGKNVHFHPNLFFNSSFVDSFPEFYKQILINWGTYFVSNSEIPSCIQSNCLWYNRHLLIDSRPVYQQSMPVKNVNFLNNLLDSLGNFKLCHELKAEFNLPNNLYFSCMQLIDSMPLNWRNTIKDNYSSTNLLLVNHHLVKKNNLISLDILHCQELYNILVYISPHKPTSQIYFEHLFREPDVNWKEIYLLPRKVFLDCYVRSFQYAKF